MTLQEAIELKQRYQYLLQDASLPQLITADNLSIEAMKAWKSSRDFTSIHQVPLLPGETKK